MVAQREKTSVVVRFPLPALEMQADLVEKHKVETLLFCPQLLGVAS